MNNKKRLLLLKIVFIAYKAITQPFKYIWNRLLSGLSKKDKQTMQYNVYLWYVKNIVFFKYRKVKSLSEIKNDGNVRIGYDNKMQSYRHNWFVAICKGKKYLVLN